MIVYIEPRNRQQNSVVLQQYFKLRKKIFCDRLRWVETKPLELEHDDFDDLYNIYILNIDDQTGQVTGGVRMMPTTGPTLMHSVWADMLPERDDFRSPNIWDATRFCVEDSRLLRKASLANRITLALSASIIDFAHTNGISHIIAVCEARFFEMTNVYYGEAEIIDRRVDANGTDICCGLWSAGANRERIAWARQFIGGADPVIVQKVA